MAEFVITLKNGTGEFRKSGSLREFVAGIGRVTRVMPTGKSVIVQVEGSQISNLKSELEDECYIVERAIGKTL
ncbi:hypothetical protein ABIF93_005787 [Bradyrhizobium japonicum]